MKQTNESVLKASCLDTMLGPMIAIADENTLYLLEFINRRGLENEIKRVRKKLKATIMPGETNIIKNIEAEIADYFAGRKLSFKTPIYLVGSAFQKKVWKALMKIPVGETRSYAEVAKMLNVPTAYRAVARANGANQLALIVPCHRVINSNGGLGGYGGGIARKRWLLKHEILGG